MKAETIRELLHKVPFTPFHLRMDNGTVHSVPHPDYLFATPVSDYVILFEQSGRMHLLERPHIASVELPKPSNK